MDPWAACAYWGPVGSGRAGGEKFCGQCGTARPPQARFCGECGAAFAEGAVVTDVRADVLATQGDSHKIAPLLTRLIDQHALIQLESGPRKQLVEKLKELLASAQLKTFIDGSAASTSTSKLTLAAAQEVADVLRRGSALSGAQIDTVRRLLVSAPQDFGYWGPIKTVLKGLDPAVLPEEFGIALARLSKGKRAPVSTADVEDLSIISTAFNLPSSRTRNYMRRRMRRQLAELAEHNPDLYASIATAMLIGWDSTLTSDSYLPAYVLFGDQQYLTTLSRSVNWQLNQEERRDAHPHIWDAHPELVERVLAESRDSVQTFTFAVQVLHAVGRPIPKLTSDTILRALSSTYPPLGEAAYQVLDGFPDVWGRITDKQWEAYFTVAATQDVSRMAMALQGHTPLWQVTQATARILRFQDGARDERLAAIASVYLAYASWQSTGYRSWWESTEADIAALAAIALVYGFDATPDEWRKRFARMDTTTVCRAYLACLLDSRLSSTTAAVLEDLITQINSDWVRLNLAYLCFGSALPAADALATRLLEATEDPAAARTSAWAWVWQQDRPMDRRLALAALLLQAADSAQASDWLVWLLTDPNSPLTAEQAGTLLGDDVASGNVIWLALAGERSEATMELLQSHPRLLVAMGSALSVTEITALTQGQEQALSQYMRAVPDWIPSNPLLGVRIACLPAPAVQEVALEQLEQAGLVRAHMVTLAECGLPLPLGAVRSCVQGMRDPEELRIAVLSLIDSGVPQVRNLGLALLDERRAILNLPTVWTALTFSDDPVVLARVAEEATVGTWPESAELAAFDRRVLVTRRQNRRAKEQVKARVASSRGDDAPLLVTPERLDALRNMAAGATARDKEWALQRLALLTLSGAAIEDVVVSVTDGGAN